MRVVAHHGARRIWYSEIYYFGNPAGYQYFAQSMNDSAPGVSGEIWQIVAPYGDVGAHNQEEFLASRAVEEFRQRNKPNTYSVTAPNFGPLDVELGAGLLGIDSDVARGLPD